MNVTTEREKDHGSFKAGDLVRITSDDTGISVPGPFMVVEINPRLPYPISIDVGVAGVAFPVHAGEIEKVTT